MPEPKFRIPPIPTFEERDVQRNKRTSSSLNTDVLVRNSQKTFVLINRVILTNKTKFRRKRIIVI
jgi:hypothetical protein